MASNYRNIFNLLKLNEKYDPAKKGYPLYYSASPKLSFKNKGFADIYAETESRKEDLGDGSYNAFVLSYFSGELMRIPTDENPNPNYAKLQRLCRDCVLFNSTTGDETELYLLKNKKNEGSDDHSHYRIATSGDGYDVEELLSEDNNDIVIEFLSDRIKRFIAVMNKKLGGDEPALKLLPGMRKRRVRGSGNRPAKAKLLSFEEMFAQYKSKSS